FVHLTFQEYLASAHLLTTIEEGGVRGIWHEIAHRTSDNRWNEVIRLMIAGLRSYQAQEWILDTLLIETRADLNFTRGILVGGLLLDGVSSAVHSAHQIIEILFLIAARTSDDQLTQILGVTRAFLNKDTNNSVIIAQGVCLSLNGAISDYEKLAILLSAGSTGLSAQEMGGLLELLPDDEMLSKCWIKLFSHLGLTEAEKDFLKPMIERFMNIQTSLSLFSESTGYWSILGLAIVDLYDSRWLSSKAFDLAMISIFYDYQSNNPMQVYFNKYFDVAFLTKLFVSRRMLDRLRNGIDLIWYKKIKFIAHDLVGEFDKLVDDGITSKNIFWLFGKPDNLIDMMGGSVNESYLKKHEEQLKSKIKPCSPFEIIIFNNPKIFVARAAIQSALQFRLTLPHWPEFQNKPELHNQFLRFVMNCFRVKISCHATEYLRFNLLPEIPKRLEKLGDYNNPQNVEVSSTYSNDPYQLAWSILLTAYINKLKKNNNFLYVTQRFRDLEMSRELLDSLRDVDNPSIQVALALLSQVSGEQIAKNDLLTLYNSDDPRYIELFKRCYWKLTEQ
nr:hypothetical protein [Anaerolineales bacterium]